MLRAIKMDVPADAYSLGARVCVMRGALAGLTGVIVERPDHELDCVLEIDGWPPGAYLALHSGALQPRRAPALAGAVPRSWLAKLPDPAASS